MSNEDTVILVSPRHTEELVFPYLEKAFGSFGGAIIHFCGNGNHLLDPLMDLPEIKGLNLGNPEEYEYREVMQKLLSRGKFYYGGWPRNSDESTESYFRRMLEPLEGKRKGLILAYGLTSEEQDNPRQIIELWHAVQDSVLDK